MVSRSSSRPWNPVREQVVNILDRFGFAEVGVMIVTGEIQRELEDDALAPRLPRSAGNVPAQVGMSMGISNSKISLSTFGGFIEIYLPNTCGWTKLGLTCFHYVDSEKDMQSSFSELFPTQKLLELF